MGDDGIIGIFRFADGHIDPDTEVTASGSSFVAMGEPGPWPMDQPVQLILEGLHQYVALTLLPKFEPMLR